MGHSLYNEVTAVPGVGYHTNRVLGKLKSASLNLPYSLEDIKISHKFRWVKEGDKKVLQCHEDGEWINIPFIEDPDAEKFTDEINDLCSMD